MKEDLEKTITLLCDDLFKTNPRLFILVERCGFLNQRERKVLINTPIFLFIDLRKRGLMHHLDARSVEISIEVECSHDVSEAGLIGKLSGEQYHEPVTTIELDGVAIVVVAVDTLFELIFVDKRQICAKTVLPLFMACE